MSEAHLALMNVLGVLAVAALLAIPFLYVFLIIWTRPWIERIAHYMADKTMAMIEKNPFIAIIGLFVCLGFAGAYIWGWR